MDDIMDDRPGRITQVIREKEASHMEIPYGTVSLGRRFHYYYYYFRINKKYSESLDRRLFHGKLDSFLRNRTLCLISYICILLEILVGRIR